MNSLDTDPVLTSGYNEHLGLYCSSHLTQEVQRLIANGYTKKDIRKKFSAVLECEFSDPDNFEKKEGTAVNTWNGKKFRYNGIITIKGWNAPLLSTTRTHRWLNPTKTDLKTLMHLNTERSHKEIKQYFKRSQKDMEEFQKEMQAK